MPDIWFMDQYDPLIQTLKSSILYIFLKHNNFFLKFVTYNAVPL